MRMLTAVLVAASVGAGFAQDGAEVKFAVASVKVDQGRDEWFKISGSRISIGRFAELGLILSAYGLKHPRDVADYASLDKTQYNIEADVGDGVTRTRKDFQPILRALLEERFHLLVHKEIRQTPVYALVVDRNGLKCAPVSSEAPEKSWETKALPRGTSFTWVKASMDSFASYLNGISLDRLVLNETGISGTYSIAMTYVSPSVVDRMGGADLDGVDIFTALREQLGLRLERKTVPRETLVVDRWERPTEN